MLDFLLRADAPIDSLDPYDWFLFIDILIDDGVVNPDEIHAVEQIARSIYANAKLVPVIAYPSDNGPILIPWEAWVLGSVPPHTPKGVLGYGWVRYSWVPPAARVNGYYEMQCGPQDYYAPQVLPAQTCSGMWEVERRAELRRTFFDTWARTQPAAPLRLTPLLDYEDVLPVASEFPNYFPPEVPS